MSRSEELFGRDGGIIARREGGRGVSRAVSQSRSTNSVIHAVRNELLGILKRAASRGQILNHCNVELMVEEAIMESNLVSAVDEIMSNCNATEENSVKTTSTAVTLAMNKHKKNIKKPKNIGVTDIYKTSACSSMSDSCSGFHRKSETRYVVKRIIFDGKSEMTYKYVAASSSEDEYTDDDCDQDCSHRGSTNNIRNHNIMKYIKKPKIIFGSSSRQSSTRFHEARSESGVLSLQPKSYASEVTLVGSQMSVTVEHTPTTTNLTEQPNGNSARASVSIIRMSQICLTNSSSSVRYNEICKTTTKNTSTKLSKADESCTEDATTAKSSKLTNPTVRVSDFCDNDIKNGFSTMCETNHLELEIIDNNLHEVSSCMMVRSVESIVPLKAHVPGRRDDQSNDKAWTVKNISKKVKMPVTQTTITTTTTSNMESYKKPRNFKTFMLNKCFAASMVPNKDTMASEILTHKNATDRDNDCSAIESNSNTKTSNSVKCKLIKTSNENETHGKSSDKLKMELTEFFEGCSKTDSAKLRLMSEATLPVKLNAKKIQQQQANNKQHKCEKETKKSAVQQKETAAGNCKLAVAMQSTIGTNQPPMIVMDDMRTEKDPVKRLTPHPKYAKVIKCETTSIVVDGPIKHDKRKDGSGDKNSSNISVQAQDKLKAHIKSIYFDEDKEEEAMMKRQQTQSKKLLEPDQQANMLAAEWLSIAKQLKRGELIRPHAAPLPFENTKTNYEIDFSKAKPFSVPETPSMQSDLTALSGHFTFYSPSELCQSKIVDDDNENSDDDNETKTINDCNKQQPNVHLNLKFTWSALVRKWEQEAEKFRAKQQQIKLNHTISTAATATNLKEQCLQTPSSSALSSASTSLPILAASEMANGDKCTSPRMSLEHSSTQMLMSRRSSSKAPGVKQIVNFKKKPAAVFPNKESFLRTVEAMNFMLDAGDTVRSIDIGLDEQELQKFRWNLEYQKREEAKRKAGKNDAATTMMCNNVLKPYHEVETQTEPLKTVSAAQDQEGAAAVFTSAEVQSDDMEESASSNVDGVNEGYVHDKNENANADTENENEAVPNKEPRRNFQKCDPLDGPFLSSIEMELLSRDYFSTLLDEIRQLLQAANLLSAKAFSNEPLTLCDVREAGRKVVQLKVVMTALSVKRLTFFMHVDKALQKQIQVMKSIVAYGKIIFPQNMGKSTSVDKEFVVDDTEKLTKKCSTKNDIERTNSETAATTVTMQSLMTMNKHNSEMHKNAKCCHHHHQHQHIMMHKQTPLSQFQPTPAPSPEMSKVFQSQAVPSQLTTAAQKSLENFSTFHCVHEHRELNYNDYLSDFDDMDDISINFVPKSRTQKLAKAKKTKRNSSKQRDFILTGFKNKSTNNYNNNQTMKLSNQQLQQLYRQFYEFHQHQLMHQQRCCHLPRMNGALVASPHLKRKKRVKKSKKDKEKPAEIEPDHSSLQTEGTPAKNAPYIRTSYELPVPAGQPTGWELFKWNCGSGEKERTTPMSRWNAIENKPDRIRRNFGGYKIEQATTATSGPPVWK